MLSEPDEPNGDPQRRAIGWTLAAAAVSGAIGIGLARLSLTAPWPTQPVHLRNDGSVAAIGTSLLTTYSLAFEVISLVLLVAILGALVIARSGRKPANAHETIATAVESTTGVGTAGRGRAGSASLRSETAAPVAASHP
jgi:hypothetical protein